MELSNRQKIGTHFKKENIFLATVPASKNSAKERVESEMNGKDIIFQTYLEILIEKGCIYMEEVDIFYKDDTGYTRFLDEGPETYAGDNSDGKGIVCNVVSAWEYYSEEELCECMLNNDVMVIGVLDRGPLNKYNKDYNKVKKVK